MASTNKPVMRLEPQWHRENLTRTMAQSHSTEYPMPLVARV